MCHSLVLLSNNNSSSCVQGLEVQPALRPVPEPAVCRAGLQDGAASQPQPDSSTVPQASPWRGAHCVCALCLHAHSCCGHPCHLDVLLPHQTSSVAVYDSSSALAKQAANHSSVNFAEPDFARHPAYAQALGSQLTAELQVDVFSRDCGRTVRVGRPNETLLLPHEVACAR